jgi:hypothetical protein
MRLLRVLKWDVQADLAHVVSVSSHQPAAHTHWIDYAPGGGGGGLLAFRAHARHRDGYDDWTPYGLTPDMLAACGLPGCTTDAKECLVTRWMHVSRVAIDGDTGALLRYELAYVTEADLQYQSEWLQGWWVRKHYPQLAPPTNPSPPLSRTPSPSPSRSQSQSPSSPMSSCDLTNF